MFGVRSTPSAVRPASFVRVVTCHAFNVRSVFLVCAALPLCRVVLFSACGRILRHLESVHCWWLNVYCCDAVLCICWLDLIRRSYELTLYRAKEECVRRSDKHVFCSRPKTNILLSVNVTASIALAVGIRSCVLWFDVVSYGTLVRAAPIR
ncbi:hypothetical protein QTP88_027092 [Uroleucon formosanum]